MLRGFASVIRPQPVRRLVAPLHHLRHISMSSANAPAIHPSVDITKLNPAIKSFCDKLNALPPVDPSRVPALVRRGMFAAFALGSNGDSDFIPRVEDHMAPLGGVGEGVPKDRTRHLRFYYPSIPKEGEAPLPVYLALHGGGWHAGSISTHDGPYKRLAIHSGCVVASLDYRMSPEHPAPAPVVDCMAAFRWIQDNAARLGVDAKRVGLVGDSAGANIVSAAALLLCNNKTIDGTTAASVSHPKPAALGLIYPSLDLTASSGPSYEIYANGFYLRTESIHHYVHLYLEGDATTPKENLPKGGPLSPSDPRVSPLLAPAEDLEALPPTLISTAGFDPLLSDGESFHKRLASAGVSVTYHCESDAIHVWMHLVAQAGEAVLAKTETLGKQLAKLMPLA